MKKLSKRLISLALAMVLIMGLFAVPMGSASAVSVKDNWVTQYDDPDINGDGTIKVLLIGNSYGNNVRSSLGYYLRSQSKKVVIGAEYIGFSGMYDYVSVDKGAEFYANGYNTTEVSDNPDIYGSPKFSAQGYQSSLKYRDAVKLTNWDIIMLQESPYGAARPNTYATYLNTFVKNIKSAYSEAHGTSAKMSLCWFMTWATPASLASGDGYYEGTHLDQYNRISACVNDYVAASGEFDVIYPCATMIQNARTADMDNHVITATPKYDGICPDNLHVVTVFGWDMIAYGFTKTLGLNPEGYDTVSHLAGFMTGDEVPAEFQVEPEKTYRAKRAYMLLQESVDNALENPQTVTQSIYTGDVKTTCNDGTNHTYSAAKVVNPTCTEGGYTYETCSKCSYKYIYSYTEKLGHTYKITAEKDPTCTENGYIKQYCTRCNDQNDQFLAGGHSYGNWEVVKAATRTETGIKRKTCTVCGATLDETIPLVTDNKTYDVAFESQEDFDEFDKLTVKADGYGGNYTTSNFMYFSEADKAYLTKFISTDTGASKTSQMVAIQTPENTYGKTFTLLGGGGYSYDATTAAPGVIYAHDDYGYYGVKTYVNGYGYVYYQHFYMTEPEKGDNGYKSSIIRNTTEYHNIVSLDGVELEEPVTQIHREVIEDLPIGAISTGNNNQQFFTYKYYVTAEETGEITLTVDLIYDDLISPFTLTTEPVTFTVDDAKAAVSSDLHTNYSPAFGFFRHTSGGQVTYSDMEGNPANHDHDSRVYSLYAEYAECEHTYTSPQAAVAATCTTAGKKAAVVCDFCGDTVSGGEEIAALGHDYIVNVTKAPTCTDEGASTTTCSRCDYNEDAVVPANGHKYDVFTVTREATCDQDGSGYGTCTVCKTEITEVLPAFGHSYSDWVIDKAATTESAGSRHKTCSTCGDVVTEVIPKIVYDSNLTWNFEGASGEADAADFLASGTRYLGHSGGYTSAPTYITAGYDAESRAFELAVPKYFGSSGVFYNMNALLLDTPEGTAPTTFNIETGYDERTANNATWTPGVIYAKDDGGVHCLLLTYHGDFKFYAYKLATNSVVTAADSYTQVKTTKTTMVDGANVFYQKLLKNGETAKYEYIKDDVLVTVYADREKLTDTDVSTYFGSYAKLQQYFAADMPAISLDTLKTMRIKYNVSNAGGKTTVTASAVIYGTEGNTYEIVYKPFVFDNQGGITYIGAGNATMTKAYADGVIGDNYENAFGVMQYGNNNSSNVNVQVYSADAFYKGNAQAQECTHESTTTVPAVAATCVAAGKTAAVVCASCGKTISGGTAVSALGHDYKETVVAPTCTTAGSVTTSCSRCDYKNTVTTEATGHTFGTATVTKEPTCTEEGVQTGTCTACGETTSETVPALGHTYSEFAVTKAATCTEEGEKSKTCAVCGDKVLETIPALGHSYGDWVVDKAATEEEAGSKHKTCSACGDTVTETIPALGKSANFAWNFTGEAAVSDALANSIQITGNGVYETANSLSKNTVTYNAETGALELGYAANYNTPINGLLVKAPAGAELTSYSTETGLVGRNNISAVYNAGVIYATDDNNVYFVTLSYFGGFRLYTSYRNIANRVDGVATDSYFALQKGTATQKYADVKFYTIKKNGEVVADYESGLNTAALASYAAFQSNIATDLAAISQDVLAAAKFNYSVTVDGGVSTIIPSMVFSSENNTYEVIFAPVVANSEGVTYLNSSYAETTNALTTSGYTPAAGVIMYGKPSSGNPSVQVYSLNVNYGGATGDEGGDDVHTHDYTAVVTAPTCEAEGYTTYTCTCGDSYVGDTVAALGHDEVTTIVDATCETAGSVTTTCSRCDYKVEEEVPALGHDEVTTTVDATCTEAGSTTTSCSRCDYKDVVTIPATGHTESDWIVDKEATGAEDGSKHTQCTVCGETIKTEVIPATGSSEETVVGDANGDNAVTVADAVVIAKFASGIIELEDDLTVALDVNGDGEVNTLDAIIISRYAVGLITEFPAKN